ncbi:MAG: hypothetical protein JWN32_4304 [Solirubrobacterales bacterium]|nr:hypothetical protein [Solirubrobacterales bacterium]
MNPVPTELLFMPDYSADPIWDAATESMVSLDRLPIGEDTRSVIREWARRWEHLAGQRMHFDDVENGKHPGPAEPVPPQAWETIERDGRALCQQLREELGDGWRVGWVSFEHARRHVQWATGGPVTLFLPASGREHRT